MALMAIATSAAVVAPMLPITNEMIFIILMTTPKIDSTTAIVQAHLFPSNSHMLREVMQYQEVSILLLIALKLIRFPVQMMFAG
jgi:hypothetical protein